ncbi:phosphatidylethanolamine-binding protein [Trametes punicea]|nr:phosphatidylethanolamine-binding protein [Trametes punicea]
MLIPLLTFATIAISCVSAQNSTNFTVADVAQAFETAKIVPDVLPSFNPTAILNVVFTDNTTGTTVTVTPGANLTREQNALRPQVFLTTNDSSLAHQTFVLAMVDPDAPTPQNPTEAQIRHLLAPGLQANGSLPSAAALVNNTPAISDYLRPTPPAGSDPHRYTLLLFVQPSNFSSVALNFLNTSTPANFNITLFAQEVGLGSPIAGNFFLTGPDANATNSTSTASSAASSSTNPSSSSAQSSGAGRAELSLTGVGLATVLLGITMSLM